MAAPERPAEVLRRRAVVALWRAEEVHAEVAAAFRELLAGGAGAGVDLAVVADDPSADDTVVLDAVRSLDRARADLMRLVCATAGRAVVAGSVPLLSVEPVEYRAPGEPPLFRVSDHEFAMTLPDLVVADELLTVTVFTERKRQVAALTGGDFGPDAAEPRRYADCPANGSGSPEECTCLSGSGDGRPPSMVVAADGTRFTIAGRGLVRYETFAGVSPDLVEAVVSEESARGGHGPLRELFPPGSGEPTMDRVWIQAELDLDPEAEPLVRDGVWWRRGGTAYLWVHLSTVPLVSDVRGRVS